MLTHRISSRGANSQISWGGKIFFGVGEIFFALSCQKLRISTPYWKQFMYWNVIKFDMLVHILNIESMKQIKKNFWESWGGRRPPSPPNWRHWFRPLAGVWLSAITCQHHLCAVSGSGERWLSGEIMSHIADYVIASPFFLLFLNIIITRQLIWVTS